MEKYYLNEMGWEWNIFYTINTSICEMIYDDNRIFHSHCVENVSCWKIFLYR